MSIEDLSVEIESQHSARQLLRHVNLHVPQGKVLGLVGESGSGKSLTALAIMGMLPTSPRFLVDGTIRFQGEDLTAATQARLRQLRGSDIALIGQDPMASFNPSMRIGQQISEPLVIHRGWSRRQARHEAIDLLERVGVRQPYEMVDAFPHEFSGGMLQRAAIAMAIGTSPSLILADEPTTALDVSVQDRIIRLLRKLCDEDGLSMLFISHDINVVASIANDLAVMRHGEVLEAGPVRSVLTAPARDYTKELLDAVPEMDGPSLARRRFTPAGELEPRHKREPADLLRVEDLKVQYRLPNSQLFSKRYKLALDGISFDVKQGEILGIVGESGSGKSTTARSVVRLLAPKRGRIMFEGVDLLALSPRRMRRVGTRIQMVFQDPFSSLNPFRTVRRTLDAVLRGQSRQSRKDRDERIEDVLTAVGLGPEFFDRYPHELSGGQRQRLGIARALILQPDVVILDEALSALDVSVQAHVLDLLVRLQAERNLTYLFVSHDLATVKSVCDRVIVMNAGEIVEQGPTAEVFGNPQNSYTRLLLEAIPNAASEMKRLS
ncbi:dipeptide ABC transporter ATP-binding protein [Nesterenkonia muleiensis]|uniref:dipeptide ABC transporter ATP-binding protein n=1 Tax=Nesterenkonia muleiensis TaxID=2282648 RepID=UPI00130072F4|nr:ABC transporter ATP-binding protein [Nesterenkonia muleiensis]